jgi:hypothetical protein
LIVFGSCLALGSAFGKLGTYSSLCRLALAERTLHSLSRDSGQAIWH